MGLFKFLVDEKLRYNTVYHPASNGMIEIEHRALNVALSCKSTPATWYHNLGLVLLGIQVVVKKSLGCSISKVTLEAQLSLLRIIFCRGTGRIFLVCLRKPTS